MKTLFGGIGILTLAIVMGLCLGFGIQAYALTGVDGCPDGDVNAFRSDFDLPNQNLCLGKIELSDMGAFDANDDFIWNIDFRDELDGWGTTGHAMFTPMFEFSGIGVNDARLDFKQFPDGSVTSRVAVMLEDGISYEIPQLWRVTGPEGQPTGYFMGNFQPSEECNGFDFGAECGPTLNDCEVQPEFCGYVPEEGTGLMMPMCGPFNPDLGHTDCSGNDWPLMECTLIDNLCTNEPLPQPTCCTDTGVIMFDTVDLIDAVPTEHMGTLTWVDQGLTIPMTQVDMLDMYSVNYNNDRDVQNWDLNPNPWSVTDHYYRFDGITPALSINTFTLQVNGEPFTLTFNVVNTGPMPVVPATTSNMVAQVVKSKSGKAIKGLSGVEVEVITPNIIIRNINDALVIQWAEPDLALFPDPFANRIELRTYVGRNVGGALTEGPSLWVATPYQSGTTVVPADAMAFLKDKIRTDYPTDTEFAVRFQYRFKYFDDDTSGAFQNRGYSDIIVLPLD